MTHVFWVDSDEASPFLRWLNFNPVMMELRWRYANCYHPPFSRDHWTEYIKSLGCATPYAFFFWAWQATAVRLYVKALDLTY